MDQLVLYSSFSTKNVSSESVIHFENTLHSKITKILMYLSMNLELSFITSTTLNTYYFEKKSDVAY